MSITPEQAKAARESLGWTKVRLAARSNQSESAVALLEEGKRRPHDRKVEAIREALEAEGIEFTADQPGVRLRSRK